MFSKLITFKLVVLTVLLAILPFRNYGQMQAHVALNAFNTPQNQPYVETYITLMGNTLAAKVVDGKLQSSVNILFTIYQDSTIVKANKYNLNGPLFSDSAISSPSFIDIQRYALPNGIYRIELSVTDKYAQNPKPLKISENVSINYNTTDIQSSGIAMLESFKKSTTENAFSRNGFDMIPYCVNYYPETSHQLAFYFETYHTDTVLGKNKPFIYYYYVENSKTLEKLNDFGNFKKQQTAAVNPLLTKIDIDKLGSGSYNLVIEVKDEKNITHLQRKFFFQRLNKAVDIANAQDNSDKRSISEYFGATNDIDTLKMFVECLWPIADGLDKERTINQSLNKDPEMMKKFIIDFWQRRSADTANPVKMWKSYYKRVQEVMVLFKCGKQKGYYSERGRVYLQYGKPDQRSQQPYEPNTYPYEIWQYYRLVDQVNGQFFTNRRFVFVNKNLGDDCFNLVHSDVRGEIYNDRWRFEVTRRNSNGVSNPDALEPGGTQNNQFNEIYNNPR
jgi:GWxTD domain-containing protein